MIQVLSWIQKPTDINSLRDFQEWKEKCDVKVGLGETGVVTITMVIAGSAVLLAAQPLPPHHQGAPRGDAQAAHLCRVPQQLSLDPRPHRRRFQLLTPNFQHQ